MRLTADVREQLLQLNEGFTTTTHYSGKNFSDSRRYTIRGGELHVSSNSNTSWADSRQSTDWVADKDETHRFLRNNLRKLETDGVDETQARKAAAQGATAGAAAGASGSAGDDEQQLGSGDAEAADDRTFVIWDDDAGEDDNQDLTGVVIAGLAIGAVAAVGYFAVKHGPALWNEKVKPAARAVKRRVTGTASSEDDSG